MATPTAFAAGLFEFEQPDSAKIITRLQADLAAVERPDRFSAIVILPDSQMLDAASTEPKATIVFVFHLV